MRMSRLLKGAAAACCGCAARFGVQAPDSGSDTESGRRGAHRIRRSRGRGRGPAQRARVARLRRGRDPTRPSTGSPTFEETTGCKVNLKDVRHLGRGRQAHAGRRLGRRVRVRRRHAAPDLRRQRASRSTPTSCPTTPTSSPDLKDKPWNSVDGVAYGDPARPRREPADVQHRKVEDPAPTSWADDVRGRLAVRRQGHGVRLADLHRRRRRVPDGHPARPRHHGPVRPRPDAVRRRHRAARPSRRR